MAQSLLEPEIANRKNILNALWFDAIDERYHDVPQAAEKTFRWIFEDYTSNEDSDEIAEDSYEFYEDCEIIDEKGDKTSDDFEEIDEGMEESDKFDDYELHPIQRPLHLSPGVSFRDWLASGSGIFHISGKPGSGKSTLMKYLWKHDYTARNLQTWAQASQKELIMACFFFWKPGSPLQRSLGGLVRSLLFHVLQQSPSIIESIFPRHWNPEAYNFGELTPRINIGNDEAMEALSLLIQESHTYTKTHCFCFFIDGLDEFDDNHGSRGYGALVNSLHEWIRTSAGAVKLCVSSRELPAFQDGLPKLQRIRLQELTRVDIEEVVYQTLYSNKRFQQMKREYPIDCQRLTDEIVEKSDGVFLWVTLALQLICNGIDNRYSLSTLFRRLQVIPSELGEFFTYIMDSIAEDDRREAYCTLLMAIQVSKITGRTWTNHLSLFRTSFISDYFDDAQFATKLDFQKEDILFNEK